MTNNKQIQNSKSQSSKFVEKYGKGMSVDYSDIFNILQSKVTGKVSISGKGIKFITKKEFEKGVRDVGGWGVRDDKTELQKALKKIKPQKFFAQIEHGTCSPDLFEINIEQKGAVGSVEIYILCPENSQATILEKISAEGLLYLKVYILIEKNGKIVYGTNQNVAPDNFVISERKSWVKNDGIMQWFDFHQGAMQAKSSVSIDLLESGANGSIYGLYEGKDNQVYDIIHQVKHSAPNTNSQMLTKGILDNKSVAHYRGLVKMENEASASTGFQKEDCLLLSPEAKVNAVPNLEIGQGDVKCSHSVTVSRMDQEKIFYLNSRGLDNEMAKEAMIMAHLAPVLKMLPHPMFKTAMIKLPTNE